MDIKNYKKQLKVCLKKSKYNSKRTKVDCLNFDSIWEADCYKQFKLLQSKGKILFFLCQTPFHCGAGVKYRLDFMVFWKDGRVSFYDAKGKKTPTYIMKKKQVEDRYNIVIEELYRRKNKL